MDKLPQVDFKKLLSDDGDDEDSDSNSGSDEKQPNELFYTFWISLNSLIQITT